jgi:hypothetical protein
MNTSLKLFSFLAMLFIITGCNKNDNSIERIIMDYPHGESRLLVERDGETLLFYGAGSSIKKVKDGTINIDELYKQLQERLHENIPRENWPDPASTAGMVTIQYKDNTEQDYLIFDEEEFAEGLFSKVRENVVGSAP